MKSKGREYTQTNYHKAMAIRTPTWGPEIWSATSWGAGGCVTKNETGEIKSMRSVEGYATWDQTAYTKMKANLTIVI
jgi:hypothetical protein